MNVTIQPSALSGTICAPPSKSAMQRACAAALVKGGVTTIHQPGFSNDDQAALDIIRQLGASVKEVADTLVIDSTGSRLRAEGNGAPVQLHCGESGLSIRMFTPIASLCRQSVKISGHGSLGSRPMDFFDEVLPQVGVKISTNGGKLPLQVQGPLVPENITVDGSLSSQFLTGLLMAYAAADATDKWITVTDLKSKPYIDLTLQVMQSFGLPVPENQDYRRFYFPGTAKPAATLDAVDFTVEGDWSGAAFLLVAGAIGSGPDGIVVEGLNEDSTQADRKILEALTDAGADWAYCGANTIRVKKTALNGFDFDATECPDLFPPLVALAAYCKGETTLKGVRRLANKESNRGLTLQEQFGKMGVPIHLEDDRMTVAGPAQVTGHDVHSCHDHRIAMACAVAALGAAGTTTIAEAAAIQKSYPAFYSHLQQLGVPISGHQL